LLSVKIRASNFSIGEIFKMLSGILIRVGSRSHLFFAALMALLALQPLSAMADQCDDAWAAYQRGSPEIRAATARSAKVDLFGDVVEQQKNKCETDKGFDELNRLILEGARRVEQACGSRRRLACNVACQEKAKAEQENKTAYDCSPSTLEAVRKADQDAQARIDADRNAERKVQNACISVTAMETFPDLPHDSEYQANVKTCNANAKICKEVRKNLEGQKWPSALTCGG
jgi:hypothetical protein